MKKREISCVYVIEMKEKERERQREKESGVVATRSINSHYFVWNA